MNTTDSIPIISIGLFEKLVSDETVEVYVKLENESTPLHIFCGWYKKDNLIDFFRLVLVNGADVNTKIEDGETPLDLLKRHYKKDNLEDIVDLLTRKGVSTA